MRTHCQDNDALERRIARLKRLCARDTRTAGRLTPRLRQLEREAVSRRGTTRHEPDHVPKNVGDEPSLANELAARRRDACLTAHL